MFEDYNNDKDDELTGSQAALSLYELNALVRRNVESALDSPVWMEAELAQVSERGGHCYLEFVQKASDRSGTLLAKARGQIWARTWAVVRPYFERTTGSPLAPGMCVMVRVEVTFHELYGYSLNVVDINPTYTLGDLARRRQEIIDELRREGVADMNKTLPLPTLMQRIAVISSDGAAGWGDFRAQLSENPHHLAFALKLFPAVMQGERVESSVVSALNRIYAESDRWDVVVIIRGGGATTDLTGFDSLPLAEHVAQFPLPIITGIGHERDDTVIDLVSHTRVKTPTAAAEFILHHQLSLLGQIEGTEQRIASAALARVRHHHVQLVQIAKGLPSFVALCCRTNMARLDSIDGTLRWQLANRIEREKHRLQMADTQLRASNPDHILRLGYSIVRRGEAVVTDAGTLKPSDTLNITFMDGTAVATVKEIKSREKISQ